MSDQKPEGLTPDDYLEITLALAYNAYRVRVWDDRFSQLADKMGTRSLYERTKENYQNAEDKP
jgi:hypothetical protein